MDNVHEENWSNLFGSAQRQQLNSSNLSQIIHQLTQGTNNPQDAIRKSVGARLFELIEEEQQRVRSGQIKGKAKLHAQNAITALIRLAKGDVTNLGDVKERALLASYYIYNEEVLYQLNSIITELDALQVEYVKRLQYVNCFMTTKSIETLKEQQIISFYESLLRSIKAGDYLKSVISLLTQHCVYTEQQSKNIQIKAQQTAKYRPEHADDFLELVNLRLQSPESLKPYTIDYRVLQHNSFMNNPNIAEYKVSELMMLCTLSPFARSIGNSLWESRVKDRYTDLIKNIDSLTRDLAKNYPEKYYSIFSQYYARHPDG